MLSAEKESWPKELTLLANPTMTLYGRLSSKDIIYKVFRIFPALLLQLPNQPSDYALAPWSLSAGKEAADRVGCIVVMKATLALLS